MLGPGITGKLDTVVLEDTTELDADTEGVDVGTCELEDTEILDPEGVTEGVLLVSEAEAVFVEVEVLDPDGLPEGVGVRVVAEGVGIGVELVVEEVKVLDVVEEVETVEVVGVVVVVEVGVGVGVGVGEGVGVG